eukprot:TRINITY_DN14415_c0_g1_i1.p1 TRINITY_DN14415_c0_g1~~TRINITY_DN14415_c0_g1_i1.p1  ORF type:complete len:481 (+),score=70.77 TRINITY_DN14415_c0_g1_i1:49-1491(+)
MNRSWMPILMMMLISLTIIPFIVFDTENVQKPVKGAIHKKPQPKRETTHHIKEDHKKVKKVTEKVEKDNKDTNRKMAHVAVVGNEKYVDGGLVLGSSLTPYKNNQIELVCMVTKGMISEDSINRLKKAGWDNVIEINSPAWRVPASIWKESFAKLHIFNLTAYQKIAYWDSDMLVIADPTSIFDIDVPTNWVAAIGSKPTKDKTYFQTGMMVFSPSEHLRSAIWSHFVSHPKKYNSLNSRDGMLLRTYFGVNYTTIPKKFSRNLDPRKKAHDLIGIHYRGGWKPWFDRRKKMQKKTEDTRKDFGYAYLLWWGEYERMHQRTSSSETETVLDSGEKYNPTEQVWLLRHTPEEYTQLLSGVENTLRNVSYPGVSFIISKEGESCSTACSGQCHEPSLSTTSCNMCSFMSSILQKSNQPPCTLCEPAIYTKERNGSSFPGVAPSLKGRETTCYYNLLLDDRGLPSCHSSNEEVQRLCPCLYSS